MFSICTLLGIAIIVIQTTIFRLPSFQGILYDLLIPLVVFGRLNLSERKAVILVVIIGFLMDLFSGGIFGLYLTAYFWIFLMVKGISNYFDVKDTLFRSVFLALCVLAENLILFVFGTTPLRGIELLASRIGPVLGQIILVAITGPAILAVLEKMHGRLQAPELSGKTERQNLAL